MWFFKANKHQYRMNKALMYINEAEHYYLEKLSSASI